ncbi:TVP38/TMEM64 family protein [Halobacterium jilantaiense]|uniref:TVP38/TMEM64 family protein n=1 Tax=Halobacterium jilantaiense TaxID=355548 RepID=UPI001FE0F8D3|nr:TVP38/TMEM64 family protein [Halobacterium jilantaiense]
MASVGVVVVFAGLYLLVRQHLPFLTNGDELRAFVAGYGVLAPLVFIGLQAAQVLIAPVPGQITAFVSGYLFGGVLGTIYSLIGVTIGSAIAFWLSRRYGRPFVESVIQDDIMKRFDAFVDKAGLPSLFALFLVPGLPDDILCFVSGLTDIPLWKLITVMFLGRAPAYVLVNVSGASLADNNLSLTVALLIVVLGFSAWGVLRRDEIMDALS